MKLVFVSNYFNHHQKSFCEEMHRRLGDGFTFISTGEMREERKKLGYIRDDAPDYVFDAHTDNEKKINAIKLINEAEVVIAGSCPEEMLRERLRSKKLIFRYSERPFKIKPSFIGKMYHSARFKIRDLGDKNVYMLCAGAYASKDFSEMGVYRNRMYKWGYFPEVKEYDTDALFSDKQKNTILWCGRFIDWKHPDDAVALAKRLRDSGYDFNLKMIGTGAMEDELKRLADDHGLADCVAFMGSMPPDQVRLYMEEAGVYLFTSDRQEGWGAVLNEAMNSGCAVVASNEIGSVSYLIEQNENGLIYKSGDLDDLFEKTKSLLDRPEQQRNFGEKAYHTIAGLWNARTAADHLLMLIDSIRNNVKKSPFKEGPCSCSEID